MVEVGSGLGLCGLTAAQLSPRHVIISEANDACLHAIHDAIQLNPTTTSTGTSIHLHIGRGCMQCLHGLGSLALELSNFQPLFHPSFNRLFFATSTLPCFTSSSDVVLCVWYVGGACEGVLCEAKWLDWDHVYPLTEDTTDPGSESDSEGEREGQKGVRVGEVGEEGEEGGEEEWRRKGWGCAPIETLLASDVIHDESCAKGMARLIRLALKDDGTWREGKGRVC